MLESRYQFYSILTNLKMRYYTMKKIFIKFMFTALVLVCFSAPSFASKGGIESIVNQSASTAFNALKNQTIEQLTTSLVNKKIEDNEAKVTISIKTDESKESVEKREAKESSGKAAMEAKNLSESSSNVLSYNKLASYNKVASNNNEATSEPSINNEKSQSNEEIKPETSTEEPNTESSSNEIAETTDNSVEQESPIIPAGSLGIDVSEFNGNIDWKAVKEHGVKFAFIRVAGRFSVTAGIYDDSMFEYNIAQAKANGIQVGVYFFTQAVNSDEAIEEARYAINKIKPYGIDLPIVIDSEAVSGGGRHAAISAAERTEVIKSFCEEVSSQGYTPMIYASTWWLNNKLNMSELSAYKVWVAQYNSTLTYNGSYNIWQYTSEGRINGISGNVDCNQWFN